MSIISHSFIAYTIGVHLNDHVIITNYAHWADTLQAVQLTSCARTRALKAVKKGTKASRASITTVGGRDTPFSARVDTEQIVVCHIWLFPTSVTTVSTRFYSHHLAPHKYLQNIMKGAIESDNLVSDTNIKGRQDTFVSHISFNSSIVCNIFVYLNDLKLIKINGMNSLLLLIYNCDIFLLF